MNAGCSIPAVFRSALCGLLFVVPVVLAAPVMTTSASGRFRVTGSDSLENTEYTRWAEDKATQFERLLGSPIPVTRGDVMEIVLEEPGMGYGSISTSCSRQGGGLKRVMTIPRTGSVDYDRMQEGFIELVLAGIVERRRAEGGMPAVIPVIPRWLNVGLAQNLDKEQLARNRKMLSATGLDLTTIPVTEVLGWENFPVGWHGQQAVCGILTAWILSLPRSLELIVDRLVRQYAVSPGWLAIAVVNEDSVEGMEARWRAWLQRQTRAVREFGGLSLAFIEQLKGELPMQINSPNGDSLRLGPAEVIVARKKYPSAVMMGAVGRMERLRMVTMGKAPELAQVADQYCRFYQGVACGSWSMVLKWRLRRADAALKQLEDLTRAREAYLDEVEVKFRGKWLGGESQPGVSAVPVLEKSAIESYIDEAEERFQKP